MSPFSVAATECTRPDAACEAVDLGAFLRALGTKLRARGVTPFGAFGMGECGEVADGVSWEHRHMSITIYDWKYANDAVTVLAEELRAWNVDQSYEVSVERMKCLTPL